MATSVLFPPKKNIFEKSEKEFFSLTTFYKRVCLVVFLYTKGSTRKFSKLILTVRKMGVRNLSNSEFMSEIYRYVRIVSVFMHICPLIFGLRLANNLINWSEKWNGIRNANFGRESDCVMIWLSGTWLLSNCLWLNLVKWRSFQDYVWQCKEVWYKHVTISDRRSTTVKSNQPTYDFQSRDIEKNFEIGRHWPENAEIRVLPVISDHFRCFFDTCLSLSE